MLKLRVTVILMYLKLWDYNHEKIKNVLSKTGISTLKAKEPR